MATLTDAGPLVALIDKSEARHAVCVAALAHVSMPLVTTWPCVTEAMYLVGRDAGWTGQELLWNLMEKDQLEIHSPNSAETRRMRALMEKYQDAPMDLADASLVATGESRELRRVFTFDSDFHVYRLNDKDTFEVIP